ncbi:MAG TPA: hypothetical protein DCP11_04665 [Microbacteriaceae bacterium]|jgi:hypothetical protein|nr:hypothetical protein [Microbacteriaceae bacterium]
MKTRNWNDLSQGQQTAVIVASVMEFALAVAAWTDLARRPAKLVNGRKGVWAAIIAVNFFGPIAYFVRGRRR